MDPQGAAYMVTFYRELVSHGGRRHQVPVDQVRVDLAPTEEKAVELAKRSFEERQRLACWSTLAHGYEVRKPVRRGAAAMGRKAKEPADRPAAGTGKGSSAKRRPAGADAASVGLGGAHAPSQPPVKEGRPVKSAAARKRPASDKARRRPDKDS